MPLLTEQILFMSRRDKRDLKSELQISKKTCLCKTVQIF